MELATLCGRAVHMRYSYLNQASVSVFLLENGNVVVKAKH